MFFSSLIAYFNTEETNLTKNGQSQKKTYKTKDREWKGNLESECCSEKRENLRPNVNNHLQKGLEVSFISTKQRLQRSK